MIGNDGSLVHNVLRSQVIAKSKRRNDRACIFHSKYFLNDTVISLMERFFWHQIHFVYEKVKRSHSSDRTLWRLLITRLTFSSSIIFIIIFKGE